MVIPTYTDAQVERRLKVLLEQGRHPTSSERWAQINVFSEWLEQVKLLSSSDEEKNNLIHLATEKMREGTELTELRMLRHIHFAERAVATALERL